MNGIGELISKYGFPIIAAMGLGYFVYYVWVWATKTVKPVISETQKTLIELIDQVRVLDNDMIRLNQKLTTVLTLREEAHGKTIITTNPNSVDDLDKDS